MIKWWRSWKRLSESDARFLETTFVVPILGIFPAVPCKSNSGRMKNCLDLRSGDRPAELTTIVGLTPSSRYQPTIIFVFTCTPQSCTLTPVPIHELWIRDIRCQSSHLLHVRSGIMCCCGSATPFTDTQQRCQIFDQLPARNQRPRSWEK